MEWGVEQVSWETHSKELKEVRHTVFVKEQKVPVELELDDRDADAIHFIYWESCKAAGVARLLDNGMIGRMAVLRKFRGNGYGSRLLNAGIKKAAELNYPTPWIHAQIHAIGFYEIHGFKEYGPIFEDAGIKHREMRYKATLNDSVTS